MKPPKGFEWSDYRVAFHLLAVLLGGFMGLLGALALVAFFPK